MGATLAINPKETSIAEAQKQLGMQEGFDVGLEMSGNPAAFRDMIANMSHGAKIAMLGIPAKEMPIDWRHVIFNMLTIKGIYGREMYETWYKMSVMLESGLDITPVITHRFHYTRFRKGLRSHALRQFGQSDSRPGLTQARLHEDQHLRSVQDRHWPFQFTYRRPDAGGATVRYAPARWPDCFAYIPRQSGTIRLAGINRYRTRLPIKRVLLGLSGEAPELSIPAPSNPFIANIRAQRPHAARQ